MARHITRRELLAVAAGTAAFGFGAARSSSVVAQPSAALPDGADAPFNTVVVLMMENRSFDHVLGWLPGANGRQAGLRYTDIDGVEHETWPLAGDPQHDFYRCDYGDPVHDWQGIAKQYNDGRCDGFLQTANAGDRFPIGYYGEGDLPILGALATGYTTYDNYFCSMLGPTWENRLYQLTGTTQLGPTANTVAIETAIFDRLREKRLTARYYYHGDPVTGLFATRKYDDISYPTQRPHADARRVQRKAAGGRAAPGVRPRLPQSGRTALGGVPDPRGGRHDARTPLPARSEGHYASPGTGMDTVHLGNVG